ncbi:hypothetical protein B0H16DRAFT_1730220 [Mycena metata]|uniref:Uncharacterized protein n=1 Tax=Mycena metata TaxID=1033252 RepID=A0AAD7I8X4_9AGAR|nr:hypothetical protein B0H16DRAFT_1730220 [Mycena metata]
MYVLILFVITLAITSNPPGLNPALTPRELEKNCALWNDLTALHATNDLLTRAGSGQPLQDHHRGSPGEEIRASRTVVLSFGFDEEAGGVHGARYIAAALLERFGPDSFAMIVDEGGACYPFFSTAYNGHRSGEKGHVIVNIEIQTLRSPEHTSTGMLAALIVHLENNAPVPVLEVGTTASEIAQCLAAHAPDMPGLLRRTILRAGRSRAALKAAEAMLLKDPQSKAVVGTTQAVDVISGGGVKSNALPEQAVATVSHRIATQRFVAFTRFFFLQLTQQFVQLWILRRAVTAYGELLTPAAAAAYDALTLTVLEVLEPAPLTPSDTPAYQLLSGTIRTTFDAARKGVEGANTHASVAPGMVTGNTDMRADNFARFYDVDTHRGRGDDAIEYPCSRR